MSPRDHRSAFVAGLATLAAILAVAVGGRLEVPMAPVPMTLQSFAVVTAGGLLGARLGALALLLYLGAGAIGLPVFAGGAKGIDTLLGATAGYLWSFPPAAALAGLGPSSGSGARRQLLERFALYAAGHGLILGLGALWLARRLGLAAALSEGLTPFLLGALVKSLAAAWLVGALSSRTPTAWSRSRATDRAPERRAQRER